MSLLTTLTVSVLLEVEKALSNLILKLQGAKVKKVESLVKAQAALVEEDFKNLDKLGQNKHLACQAYLKTLELLDEKDETKADIIQDKVDALDVCIKALGVK